MRTDDQILKYINQCLPDNMEAKLHVTPKAHHSWLIIKVDNFWAPLIFEFKREDFILHRSGDFEMSVKQLEHKVNMKKSFIIRMNKDSDFAQKMIMKYKHHFKYLQNPTPDQVRLQALKWSL